MLKTLWVLLVVSHGNGPDLVTTHSFTSKEACVASLEFLAENDHRIDAACIEDTEDALGFLGTATEE